MVPYLSPRGSFMVHEMQLSKYSKRDMNGEEIILCHSDSTSDQFGRLVKAKRYLPIHIQI